MSPAKRSAADNNDPSLSPPPTKRRVESTLTNNAVADFFKPTSQKKDQPRIVWSERSPNDDAPATLLIARYHDHGHGNTGEPPEKRRKVAAFDLDSTLITSASGKKFSNDASDWKWWHASVPNKLRNMYKDGYQIVILSNQNGLTLHRDSKAKGPDNSKRVAPFKQKAGAVLAQLDIPTSIYAATGKDIFRKPRTGMWKELCEDYGLQGIDKEESIFVGDAGGRTAVSASGGKKAIAKDFSCSDRNFAHNVGIRYHTPEEFFLGEEPREFVRNFDVSNWPFPSEAAEDGQAPDVVFENENDKDLVLFCGPPGAGKSTFYWRYLKPLGYERVNQDTLKSKDKCFKVASEHLEKGNSVAVDNTNPDLETRRQWIDLAKKNGVPIRCVWFKTPLALAEHNDAVRAMNKEMNPEARSALPKLAFNGFASRFKQPQVKEGFQDIVEVDFEFRGTRKEYDTWGRYWT